MNFLRLWGQFMMAGARAHAKWELDVSNTILRDKRRLMLLGLALIPIVLGGYALADQIANGLPEVLELTLQCGALDPEIVTLEPVAIAQVGEYWR